MNKKASATIILGILLILVILGLGINIASRECNSNDECPKEHYCGSDFRCHKIPVIKETIVKNNLLLPSIIIASAIIISSWILNKKQKQKKPHFRYNDESHLYEPTFDQPKED